MARAASSCAAFLAQRRAFSSAITIAEESAMKVQEKAVKLGTVASDGASSPATSATEEKTAFWEPDPENGYYRPVTGTKEVDLADMRAEMMKQRMMQD